MCLGVPGRVIRVDGTIAVVDFFGVSRQVRLELVDEPVAPGDYILNHVGFAIRRIPQAQIAETLALYEQLLREAENDIMAADVRGELRGARGDEEPGPFTGPAVPPIGREDTPQRVLATDLNEAGAREDQDA